MSALTVALSALTAQQQAMLVTSQNIANAGTAGYSAQRTVLTANALTAAGSALWGGVQASAIDSARDRALDARIISATTERSRLEASGAVATDVEALFGTVDGTNLQTLIESVASAFNDMAVSPADDAVAAAAVEALGTLAAMLNQVAAGIDDIAASVADQAAETVSEVNRLLSELAEVNRAIQLSSAPVAASEYADKQALLLQELAGHLQIKASYQNDGTVSVTCGGTALLSGTTVRQVALTGSASAGLGLIMADTLVRLDPGSGSLDAYLDAVNTELPQRMAELDAIALALIGYLGAQQAAGAAGGSGSTTMTSETLFSAAQLAMDIDDIAYDPVHGFGFAAGLAPELPDSGSSSVMRLTAYDDATGLADAFILVYDAGSGPTAAGRTLQDLVDAINTGSGGGFSLQPPAAGALQASLVPSGAGYRLVISTSDGRTLDLGAAVDARPTDGAAATEWSTGDAGFTLSGAYGGGAASDPAQPMTVQVVTAGTIGDDDDPPTIRVSIPVESGGVVTMQETTYVLDSSLPAGVPIDLGYGLRLTFDAGTLSPAAAALEIAVDASDDRTGVLAALGLDAVLAGSGARDIHVAAAIAADPTRLATGSSRAAGASDIATAMAELASKARTGSGTAVVTAYQRLVSSVGRQVSEATSMGEVQDLVLATLENQRQLLIGVDIDEQMAKLIEQQHAYSAAARVISMVRENNDTLMAILS